MFAEVRARRLATRNTCWTLRGSDLSPMHPNPNPRGATVALACWGLRHQGPTAWYSKGRGLLPSHITSDTRFLTFPGARGAGGTAHARVCLRYTVGISVREVLEALRMPLPGNCMQQVDTIAAVFSSAGGA